MLPDQIKEAEQRQVEEIQKRVHRSAAFQRVLRDNPDGELVLKEIETFCKGNTLIIQRESTQTQIIADAAKKDVWQFIKNCMDVDVEKTSKMLEEFKNASDKKE
jgi:hypothetical protein